MHTSLKYNFKFDTDNLSSGKLSNIVFKIKKIVLICFFEKTLLKNEILWIISELQTNRFVNDVEKRKLNDMFTKLLSQK